jgi:hypothetical protein
METAEKNAEQIEKLTKLVLELQANHSARPVGPPVVLDQVASQQPSSGFAHWNAAASQWTEEWYKANNLEPEYTDTAREIGERIVIALREFNHRYESGEKTTPLLRGLARDFVTLRGEFRDDEGTTDWRGKTWDYRTFVGELYDASGVDHEVRYKLQTGLRYHVSNELRKQVPADELDEVGLITSSARTRQGEARRLQADLVADIKDGDKLTNMNPTAPRSWELSATAVHRSIRRLVALDPVKLTYQQREMMVVSLQTHAQMLQQVVEKLQPSTTG